MYMSFPIPIFIHPRPTYNDPNSYTEFERSFHVAHPISGGEMSELELEFNWSTCVDNKQY